MASHHHQAVVVMVPFPAQGHLNQLLHLARLIASYDIHVHYVGSTTHNRQAKLRCNAPTMPNIHFHNFPTPSFLSPPPNPHSTIKFPSHLQPSFDASSHLRHPFATLIRSLSSHPPTPTPRRVVVIYDSLMASVVQDIASVPNAESYSFHSISAFALLLFSLQTTGRPFPIEAHQPSLKDLPSIEGCFTSEFMKFIKTQHAHKNLCSGRLYNTSRALEAPFLDFLAKDNANKNKIQWALGPFNPVKKLNSNVSHQCLDWLDKQAPNSVIYVSFGTTTSFTEEQIKEIAIGLEQSQQRFIWVLRDADKGDVFTGEEKRGELPEGYEERVEGRGMVVGDWAPQLEILGHPSTGGFVSHCGWNSCMESITMGVPVAAWPMHSDQPWNTVLMIKLLRVGVVLKEWARRDELVTASMVEKGVKTLMASKEGEEMRKRAAELGSAVRRSAEEGGVSRKELDSFIAHITR